MHNAPLMGALLPIHSHIKITEPAVMVRGKPRENFYTYNGEAIESIKFEEETVILETKDGAYVPLSQHNTITK